MTAFVRLVGLDGCARAVQPADIRMLADEQRPDGDDEWEPMLTVTLCDGTQFCAKGDVAGILKQIDAMESH